MMRIKHLLIPFGMGLLGVVLALTCWHVWDDHRRLHLIDQQVGVWQATAIQQANDAPK